MLSEMKYANGRQAEELSTKNPKKWHPDQLEPYASKSMWFYVKLNVIRQIKILVRDETFLAARIGQNLLVGAIVGSLFSNIDKEDVATMNGFIFNTLLFNALGSIALLPILYAQKAVFYKMKDEYFFPTLTFTFSQTLSFIPLQITEAVFYGSIVYWSAGLSDEHNGSRFLTYVLMCFVFALVMAQLFRFVSSIAPSQNEALPIVGIALVIMVLFSGFIQPKTLISDGWIWFYWLNPIAWALKSVTVNEFISSKYDFQTCVNYPSCTITKRFGDVVLDQFGNPKEEEWIWYSFAVLMGEFIFLFIITTFTLAFTRSEPAPPAPYRSNDKSLQLDMKTAWENLEKQEIAIKNTAKNGESKITQEDESESFVRDLEQGTTNIEIDFTSKETSARKSNKANSALYVEVPSSVKASERHFEELQFDKVSFAFTNIWYTVTLANKEEVDLLKGVNGYFEPGTMSALMGSSGAGKTTLLDVLAGRKNMGVVKGKMFVNGVPKVEGYFRKIMGYVEQFDTLPPKSTAREAIEFSAALRLASNISAEQREKWVNSVISMLDLETIENDLVRDLPASCWYHNCHF